MEPRTTTKLALTALPGTGQPLVSIVQWAYRVDYGPGVRPRLHTVSKQRCCQCLLGAECPAVLAVSEYLRAGGDRAPDPPFDFWPRVPEACPICGGETEADPGLFSRQHGQGWRCAQTGGLCYWAARTIPLIMSKPARIYVVPPSDVPMSNSTIETEATVLQQAVEKMRAWVAAIADQQACNNPARYPGITLQDMAAARDYARARRAAWATEGYFPDD